MTRTGSGAPRPIPRRKVQEVLRKADPDAPASHEPTPTRTAVRLGEIADERTRVAARKKELEGMPRSHKRVEEMRRMDARLSVLNNALRQEERKLLNADYGQCLKEAVLDLAPPELSRQILDRAMETLNQRLDTL